ncbi:hypothetical protein L1987_59382 [Smallanthus sonchifolius]|uniref:Uncharacterized protein n=1 Tax=Smallanthus sonchifolius TaxID=185202 RepID=A0ACB9D5P3_9ASTR|nr:hypothetical protein L1987_59382 [Smallanthus sonchifolius]
MKQTHKPFAIPSQIIITSSHPWQPHASKHTSPSSSIMCSSAHISVNHGNPVSSIRSAYEDGDDVDLLLFKIF